MVRCFLRAAPYSAEQGQAGACRSYGQKHSAPTCSFEPEDPPILSRASRKRQQSVCNILRVELACGVLRPKLSTQGSEFRYTSRHARKVHLLTNPALGLRATRKRPPPANQSGKFQDRKMKEFDSLLLCIRLNLPLSLQTTCIHRRSRTTRATSTSCRMQARWGICLQPEMYT